ncbi:hypothetical protein [Billgrantia ethanolica]|uniref:Uncharacterized protein n=1 Tax=Billgrantia ethanolica TaxID=2733486 RepID=A0ABS9A8Z0_9GAMM|nr:hypothetical protein [Halomonas ethanolica]MCE8004254.1 hypothetical protein [Halomonas ethanolica]
MTEHTIVVRFPEGATPTYGAVTEFQGGHVVAVDFGGNRLRIEQELAEALDQAMTSMLDSGYSKDSVVIRAGMAALAKAQGVS